MLETYRELRDKENKRSMFIPPAIWDPLPIHYIVGMELVHGLEVDIDKLVQVLEVIVDDEFNPDPRYVTQKKGKRSRDDDDSSEESK
jgi:hypothetical protein